MILIPKYIQSIYIIQKAIDQHVTYVVTFIFIAYRPKRNMDKEELTSEKVQLPQARHSSRLVKEHNICAIFVLSSHSTSPFSCISLGFSYIHSKDIWYQNVQIH